MHQIHSLPPPSSVRVALNVGILSFMSAYFRGCVGVDVFPLQVTAAVPFTGYPSTVGCRGTELTFADSFHGPCRRRTCYGDCEMARHLQLHVNLYQKYDSCSFMNQYTRSLQVHFIFAIRFCPNGTNLRYHRAQYDGHSPSFNLPLDMRIVVNEPGHSAAVRR